MGSLANTSTIQCINGACKTIPKVVFLFNRGKDKVFVLTCGKHKAEGKNYDHSHLVDFEMNIIRMPGWINELQEKELTQIKKESESGGKGKEN